MNFGVYFSTVGEFSQAALLADLAQEAEECNWKGVFLWDHLSGPGDTADPWVALAAMAMRTRRVKLGTIVTPLARRRPWKLARETVTLDHLSHGRLVVGAGLGWGRAEFEPFGEEADPRIRAEKLDEALEVLVGLWSGEKFSFAGKHYQIHEACFLPRPVQSPRIPVWVCGAWPNKKAPFRRAARWDGVVAICGTGEDRAISPAEVSAARDYIKAHRLNNDPFEVVVILWSEGGRTAEESAQVAAYEEAGVTWWLEDLSLERFTSVDEARKRLRRGPPGGK